MLAHNRTPPHCMEFRFRFPFFSFWQNGGQQHIFIRFLKEIPTMRRNGKRSPLGHLSFGYDAFQYFISKEPSNSFAARFTRSISKLTPSDMFAKRIRDFSAAFILFVCSEESPVVEFTAECFVQRSIPKYFQGMKDGENQSIHPHPRNISNKDAITG